MMRRESEKMQEEWNKGFKEYFAVKATPNPTILKILHEEGCGTDCSSLAELIMSEKCGIKGQDIMFSSNDTPAEEFKKAAELGAIINLDDITHIDFLNGITGVPKTICCRFNPGGVFTLGASGEAVQVCLVYKIRKLGYYYPALAGILFRLAVKIKEETGIALSFINLSGGVGIAYKPDQTGNDIMAIGEGVRKQFEEILVPAGMGNVRIFTELGRFMLAPYGHLVTKAIHEKHTYKEYVGVDACAANLMRPAMYGSYHHITVLGKEDAPLDHVYDVTGSLCENNDKFAIDRELPEIEKGDYLVIHDTGAHGFAMGYNYNGRLWSAELLKREDGSVIEIRRAETLNDYFATLDGFWDIL